MQCQVLVTNACNKNLLHFLSVEIHLKMIEILNRRHKIASNILYDIAVILCNKDKKKFAKLKYLFDYENSTVFRCYFSFGKL